MSGDVLSVVLAAAIVLVATGAVLAVDFERVRARMRKRRRRGYLSVRETVYPVGTSALDALRDAADEEFPPGGNR